jgi:hypothetical protein
MFFPENILVIVRGSSGNSEQTRAFATGKILENTWKILEFR